MAMRRADAGGGPQGHAPGNRLHTRTSSPPGAEVIHRISDGSVNRAVAGKLLRLHYDHGYFTRAEIAEALGLDSPAGWWECPGQFDADGRIVRHCDGDAA